MERKCNWAKASKSNGGRVLPRGENRVCKQNEMRLQIWLQQGRITDCSGILHSRYSGKPGATIVADALKNENGKQAVHQGKRRNV
jgi:hypothetical protein